MQPDQPQIPPPPRPPVDAGTPQQAAAGTAYNQPSVIGAPSTQPQPIMPAALPADETGPKPQATPVQVKNPNSTQNSLLITEIRDGLVVMNDGSFRAVVACKSINFDLMSEREREGVEFSYQNFLNSLYFPVQIFIRSQRVDIGPYIERLDKVRRNQDNMLLGVLMDDYINFIAALAEETNIMDKQFYVVVPYFTSGDISSAVNSSKGMLANLVAPQKQMHIKIDETMYNKAKEELNNRANTVLNGLFQLGIRCAQLNTKELSELYYNVYNPDTAVRQPIGSFEDVTSAVVIQKGQGQAPQPNLEKGEM